MSLSKEVSYLIECEIKGEVENEGVYELKRGDDLEDLIQAAGGVKGNADLSAYSLLEKLEDGQVVVIRECRNPVEKPLISINTASEEQLDTLPWIGPAIALSAIHFDT